MVSFLKLFSGPSAEILEKKGDTYFDAGKFGSALQAFEQAAYKIERQHDIPPGDVKRISDKILQTRDALAREHEQNAHNLLEGGFLDEARDMLRLAMEVSQNESYKKTLLQQLRDIEDQQIERVASAMPDLDTPSSAEDDPPELPAEESDEDYFLALCGTLPEAVQDEYLQYGQSFKAGYIALNRGDFQTAIRQLSHALTENQPADTYIPLELATAHLNIDQQKEAQALLKQFLIHHPEVLPAYQLLCDIYWERGEHPKVDSLLDSIPDDFTESLAVVLLRGEALFQAGRLDAARVFYHEFISDYGWNDTIARRLAETLEMLDDSAGARDIYKEIMGRCNSCHTRIDPVIKHMYAYLFFAYGIDDTNILDIYLSLAREIPEHARLYFDRISQIYTKLGNVEEATRFRAFAKKAGGN